MYGAKTIDNPDLYRQQAFKAEHKECDFKQREKWHVTNMAMYSYLHFLIDSHNICFQRVIFDTWTLYREELQKPRKGMQFVWYNIQFIINCLRLSRSDATWRNCLVIQNEALIITADMNKIQL